MKHVKLMFFSNALIKFLSLLYLECSSKEATNLPSVNSWAIFMTFLLYLKLLSDYCETFNIQYPTYMSMTGDVVGSNIVLVV